MQVELTNELEEFLLQKLRSGAYPSANDVIRDALDLLRQRDLRLVDLQKEIAIGIVEADRGDTAQWNADDIKAEGRKLLAARRKRA